MEFFFFIIHIFVVFEQKINNSHKKKAYLHHQSCARFSNDYQCVDLQPRSNKTDSIDTFYLLLCSPRNVCHNSRKLCYGAFRCSIKILINTWVNCNSTAFTIRKSGECSIIFYLFFFRNRHDF